MKYNNLVKINLSLKEALAEIQHISTFWEYADEEWYWSLLTLAKVQDYFEEKVNEIERDLSVTSDRI